MTERDPIRRRRAVFPKRHWVRLTRTCNSRCRFCLDATLQNGEMRDESAVRRDIQEGLKQGAEAVILSGGEPTVHPEFLSIVAFAAGQGLRWIQVVTNGRMFAYPDFARQAAGAGLTEATLSIHSHSADVHDRLCGVEGGFEQAVRGLRNLVGLGTVQVNVDLVVCKPNVAGLPETLDFFWNESVREFDLLWLSPAGRALERTEELEPDPNRAVPYVRKALEGGRKRGVGIQLVGAPRSVVESVEDLVSGPAVESPRPDEAVMDIDGGGYCPLDLQGEDKASVVIRTGCRNSCTFCTTRIINLENRAPWFIDPVSKVLRTLEDVRSKGYRSVRFAAIEPLEHPDILTILRKCRELGFDPVEVWSHAGPLADMDFARAVVKAGLTALDVPVFGPDADVHDAIAGRSGAFEETLKGLQNLRGLGFERISAHMVVARGNHTHVAETLAACEQNAFGPVERIVLAAPSSPDAEKFRPVAAPLSELTDALAGAQDRLPERLLRKALSELAENMPTCVLVDRFPDAQWITRRDRAAAHPYDAVKVKDYSQGLDGDGRETRGFDLKQRSPCPKHEDCGLSRACPGLFGLYLKLYGDEELTPRR